MFATASPARARQPRRYGSRATGRVYAIATTLALALVLATLNARAAHAWGPETSLEDELAHYESAHFDLWSDLHPDFSEQILEHMERVYAVYAEILPTVEPDTRTQKLRIKAFTSIDDFQQYLVDHWGERPGRRNFVYHHVAGRRDVSEVNAYWKPARPFFESLQHETFHAYFRASVAFPPQWINEGLAEYLEATRFLADRTEPFLHYGWVKQLRELVLPRDSRYRRVALQDLLTMSKNAWLMEQGATYPLSWAFVYYLLQERDDGAALLTRYVDQLALDASREDNTEIAWRNTFTPEGNPDAPDPVDLAASFNRWLDALTLGESWTAYRRGRLTLNDPPRQMGHFRAAIEADPDFYAPHFFLANALLDANDPGPALDQATAALALFPEYTSAMEAAVRAAARLGEFAVAEYWLGQVDLHGPSTAARLEQEADQVAHWRRDNPDASRFDACPPPTGRVAVFDHKVVHVERDTADELAMQLARALDTGDTELLRALYAAPPAVDLDNEPALPDAHGSWGGAGLQIENAAIDGAASIDFDAFGRRAAADDHGDDGDADGDGDGSNEGSPPTRPAAWAIRVLRLDATYALLPGGPRERVVRCEPVLLVRLPNADGEEPQWWIIAEPASLSGSAGAVLDCPAAVLDEFEARLATRDGADD